MSLTFIDFFAGVGGFRRGMELAGHKCVGFCEFNKYAVASYTAMHLLTNEQLEYIQKIEAPVKKNGTSNFAKRQKEILKEEYKNGEWYANDVRKVDADSMPRADVWCFGFPCQDISVAGKQLGFNGKRSSLFYAVTRIVRNIKEEDRPEYLFIENVKNLLSVNGGVDFLKLLIELEEIGYDAQWQVLNSKDFGVPQNRERVFIIGHLRGRGGREVFPITGAAEKNTIKQLIGGMQGQRVYDPTGTSVTLSAKGGGQGAKTGLYALPTFCDLTKGKFKTTENARCLKARYDAGVTNRGADNSGVAIPVLTPERTNKRQNGRRFKEDGEPMFTLTAQDRHGVAVKEATKKGYSVATEGDSINLEQPNSRTRRGRNQGVLQNIKIRKLTPKECFRLQGWTDDYYEKAAMVNSDSQLYKQAGNGVTVNVIKSIAERLV